MSNIHVLERSDRGVRVVMHVPIPNINNSVNVSYRTAIINSGRGGTTILKDGDGTAGTISSAEKTSIQSGALYEVTTVLTPDAVPAGSVNAYLDSEYTRVVSEVQAALQQELRYFGATR